MEIYNWIVANKMVIGGIAIAVVLGGGKAVEFVKSLLNKVKTKTSVTSVKVEVLDQDAIRHLRMRAAQLKNTKLIAVIKEADSIFYDIHVGASNEV
jgi:hypothetical protein